MIQASRKCVLLAKALKTTLKPEVEPTIIACLAGRDAQEVLFKLLAVI